jgi:hypothetical protein
MKRPSIQFYPGDWQRDAALRSCSVGARGLWIEMICLMHEGAPYGHLAVNGAGISPRQLARMVGAAHREVVHWLDDLERAGVYSKDDAGRIFSRRMVKDERVRNVRAEAGRLGGNPALLVNSKDKQIPAELDNQGSASMDKQAVNHEPNQGLTLGRTPASASASAIQPPPTPSRGNGKGKRKREESPVPDPFDVSEGMAHWAVEHGVPSETLQAQTEKFLDHHRAKGTRFKDWAAAWRTWMRNAVEYAQPGRH